MKKIAIVGAGFSGLSLAHELSKLNSPSDYEIHVFDRRPSVGGMVSTGQTAFGIYEMAANGLLNTVQIENFFEETGISFIGSSKKAKKRFIFRNLPKQWPLNFFETFQFLYHILRSLLKGKTFRQPRAQETIQVWADRIVGPAAANNLVAAALQGIYAGDIVKMSASLVLGPIFHRQGPRLKPKLKSSLLSSKNGLGSIMSQLQSHLEKKNVQFHLGQDFNFETDFDYTVIATSFFDAEKILENREKTESSEALLQNIDCLKKIEALPLVTTTCFLQKSPEKYNGFGVLFPKAEKIQALGVLMNTFIFDRNKSFTENSESSYYSETWIMGGANQPKLFEASDSEIQKMIYENRKKVFQDEQPVLEFKINRWPKALPHYTVELENLISKIQPMPRLVLHGNYLGSIGLSRLLEKSQKIALQMHQEFQKTNQDFKK